MRQKSLTESSEIDYIKFNAEQAELLNTLTELLIRAGGPEAKNSARLAITLANRLRMTMLEPQLSTLSRYAEGHSSALLFDQMHAPINGALPETLPPLAELETDVECLHLSSRNQILLALVEHRPFAFDLDNEGRLVRYVANFKGGGRNRLANEPVPTRIELSSHAGLSLGPHTEAPYHCSRLAADGHSPAPCALILTARWNPSSEPTSIIPMNSLIERIGVPEALALTSRSFEYTRSDSFVYGRGEQSRNISIIEFDEHGLFSIRFNDYRFSATENACGAAKAALEKLRLNIRQAVPLKITLQPNCALLINNSKTLHCRDEIKDNRRLLIRLFGYSKFAKPIVMNADPLIVQG